MTRSRDLRDLARVLRAWAYFLKVRWVHAEDVSDRRLWAEGIAAADTIANTNDNRAEFLAWVETRR